MKTDLLLKLADLLDTVPKNRFYYDRWFSRGDAADTGALVGECGTTACALGWATTMPETGLSLVTREWGELQASFVVHEKTKDDVDLNTSNTNAVSLLAACFAFDITREQARSLFVFDTDGPGRDASAKKVADWIRTVVAREMAKKEKTT